MTSAESETAKAFLKAASWNIETAIDRFYAFGGDASKLAPPANNNAPSSINPQQPQSGLMSATANMISGALGNFFGAEQAPQQSGMGGMGGMRRASNHNHNVNPSSSLPSSAQNGSAMGGMGGMGASGLSQMDQDALLAQQLAASSSGPQQPFIRAPDASYSDRMVGPYSNQFGSTMYKQRRDAQENFAKDWQKGPRNQKSTFLGALFSDPQYKFQGSLEDAKKKGSRENKWLLINIQDTENFCSHCLNRDIWKDKDLMPVIRESFIFYQWVTKTDNAKRVINLYHPTKFPCIFICDPNTGRQEHEFPVPDSPDKISQLKPKLLEFLDDYPNPKAKPKKVVPKNIPSKQLAPQTHEDQALQQAIQASLQESKEDEIANDNSNNSNNGHTEDTQQKKQPMEEDNNNNNNGDDEEDTNMDNNNTEDNNETEEEQLEPQPDGKDPNATAIRIRMPNGSILQRFFLKEAKVSQLYIW
eukprot:CAMPEP_0201574186 /NCGR_PEP_ID=MMETSP0190_2-20130828/18497_1 /ASSEMBLY_ACC=CAM_ASM_000263 /TAXON_ID=37353 /ORGANISM="Rosalina sp." /LENGTH=472 /DNA_ID=CAMNT_0048002083 /DNA_START=75 /DNA_END=1490 /DNA_ORIENTATION=-